MLDTKLKNNKFIINTVVIISILIASIGMCLSYPRIQRESSKFSENIFENEQRFLRDINQINYTLYLKMNEVNGEKKSLPSDILLNVDENIKLKDESEYSSLEYEDFISIFNSYIDELKYSSFENLDHYAINKENKEVIQNKQGKINELLNKTKDKITVDELKNQYQFYMVIDFDEVGNIEVSDVYGADRKIINTALDKMQMQNTLYNGDIPEGVNLNKIKNMKVVYAVPKEVSNYDSIYNYIDGEEAYSISQASTLYINIAMIFILIVALLIPYKEIKNILWFENFMKIPFEIIFLLLSMCIAFIYGASEIIIINSLKGELINISQLQLDININNILIYIINLVYWMLAFGLTISIIFTAKNIFKVGINLYFKENSIIFKGIKYLTIKIKKFYKYSTDLDISKKDNKKIMIILLVNLIILIIMCSMWFLGIIVALIYTAILIAIIKKHYSKIRYDYSNLLNITNEIGNGNLDVNIDKDLGIFNLLKYEIENIQHGFKTAVDEEVKSQKMKTELISNVSHDLKTPLTSIITYVDLLKDTKLSEEKRELYLDTLEKKSQRLQVLIEDLFEVSKATSGNIILNKIDVDVVSLMKQTLLELDDKIKESSLIVRSNYPNGKVILSLDSQRMFRVFENLVINITKYAMQGSRVYIDITENEEYVEISFKNMTKDEITFNINELAERFVRGDKSRNTEGSGLGLAIAKSFVELQGGIFNLSIDGDLFKVVIKFAK